MAQSTQCETTSEESFGPLQLQVVTCQLEVRGNSIKGRQAGAERLSARLANPDGVPFGDPTKLQLRVLRLGKPLVRGLLRPRPPVHVI